MKINRHIKKYGIIKTVLILFIFLNILKYVKSEDVKVSIIIPTHNSEEYIERTISRCLNQTLKEIEVIVVDDNSSDKTVDILNCYRNDKRMKISLLNIENGPSEARNVGISLALGEFIGFVDSDDYVDNEFYEYLYSFSKDMDIVIGSHVISPNGSGRHARPVRHKGHYGRVWDSIWRRSFINEHNIRFDVNLRNKEDIKFRSHFNRHNPRSITPPDKGIYYYYKIRKGSLRNFTDTEFDRYNNKSRIDEEEFKYERRYKEPFLNTITINYLLVIIIILLVLEILNLSFKQKKQKNGTEYEKLIADNDPYKII